MQMSIDPHGDVWNAHFSPISFATTHFDLQMGQRRSLSQTVAGGGLISLYYLEYVNVYVGVSEWHTCEKFLCRVCDTII